MRRYARYLFAELNSETCRRALVRSFSRIWSDASDASSSKATSISSLANKTERTLDRRWNAQSSASTATVTDGAPLAPSEDPKSNSKDAENNQTAAAEVDNQVALLPSEIQNSAAQTNKSGGEEGEDGRVELNADRIPLAYDLPRDWYSRTIPPSHRRDRLVTHLSEWAKRRIMTPKLLLKLLQDPLSPYELSRYSSTNISRIVYAIGLIKKTDRLIGHPTTIESFLKHLWNEATDRKRLMTYDGIGLSQTAFGFSMMQLDDPNMFTPFAEEAVKPHRIRNTLGKCLVNLLDSLHYGGYHNPDHVEIISRAAVQHVEMLPTFAIPRLMNAWGHFNYSNTSHIRVVLSEALKETRLNALLAVHIGEMLNACAKMQFKETKYVTAFVRELIYSQKWKFMTHGSLPRIVWSLGTLQYEYPSHWKQLLEATLVQETLMDLETNMIVDIYAGWSKVSFRDSQLLDQLGEEAIKAERLEAYSTRQLFEIFKAQRCLGQVEKKYSKKFLDRLRNTEKLMKCNVETKIQMVLYPNAKVILGMDNVEALMKAICQPNCLEPVEDRVLMQLAQRLATLDVSFEKCFGFVVKEAAKIDRLRRMDTALMCRLLGAWLRLGHSDNEALKRVASEASVPERLQPTSAEELLKLIWTIWQLDKDIKMPALLKEAMRRQVSTFTAKGISMLLSIVVEQELDKEDVGVFVEGLLEDVAVGQASTSTKMEIGRALKSLGFENEAEKLERWSPSKK